MDRLKNIWGITKSLVYDIGDITMQGIYWTALGVIIMFTNDEALKQLAGLFFVAVGIILANLGEITKRLERNQEEILKKLSKDN